MQIKVNKVNKEIEFVISVTFKEAEWLRDYLRYPDDRGECEESDEDGERREQFFIMLNRTIQEHH